MTSTLLHYKHRSVLISSPVDPDEVMTDGTTDGTSGGATGGKYGSSDSEDNLYTTSLRLCSHCSAINMSLASITERPAVCLLLGALQG